MPFFTLGLNHRSAPLQVRERVVFNVDALPAALRDMAARAGVEEAAIISTCNRTEIYASTEDPQAAERLRGWLAQSHNLDPDWLAPHLYAHRDGEALRHLLRVSAGLDSLVLGEPQILGQAKDAYLEALNAGTMGRLLGRAFQHAFATAKQVRTETAIGSSPVSVAFAAVSLAKQIFGDLSAKTALLIGAGEMIELTARHLHQQGVRALVIANRTAERAQNLATAVGGKAVSLEEIPEQLVHSDIVISSTAAPLPILGKGAVERALKRRRHRPIFMVDMAVPRDIEPQVGELADVYLYAVDDLKGVIDEGLRSRQEAAVQAEQIIDLQVERFMAWLRGQEAIATLRRFRDQAGAHRDEVLERARRRLARGESPEATLQYLAHTLTNHLLHAPTIGIREAAGQGDHALVEAARTLLAIDDKDLPKP